MFQDTPAWRAHQRKRMRTNAHLAIRHDAYRFMPPGAPRYVGKDVVRYFWPDENVRRLQAAERKDSAEIAAELDIVAERDELLRLKRELAAIKFELQLRRLLHDRKYSPNQPRVPAGSREGGQWTSGGGAIANGERSIMPESTSDSGHGEPQSILDVTPDAELQPDVNQVAARTQAQGHHYVPQGVFNKYPLPEETRKVFEGARTGPLLDETTNFYDAQHRIYNRAVDDLFRRFIDRNNIEPERMTPDEARGVLKEVFESKDPRIRNQNMRIWSGEIMQRLIRRLRGLPD